MFETRAIFFFHFSCYTLAIQFKSACDTTPKAMHSINSSGTYLNPRLLRISYRLTRHVVMHGVSPTPPPHIYISASGYCNDVRQEVVKSPSELITKLLGSFFGNITSKTPFGRRTSERESEPCMHVPKGERVLSTGLCTAPYSPVTSGVPNLEAIDPAVPEIWKRHPAPAHVHFSRTP